MYTEEAYEKDRRVEEVRIRIQKRVVKGKKNRKERRQGGMAEGDKLTAIAM